MNTNEIATKADIQEILKAIQELKTVNERKSHNPEFLRSADVRKLLKISDGSLQRMRISHPIIAKKINGTWFYNYSNLKKIMDANA